MTSNLYMVPFMTDRFGGAASSYARHRAGHGDLAIERLAKTSGRDATVLDLESSLYEHRVVYDAVIGLRLSCSSSSPARLGYRVEAFKGAARRELLALEPSGRWPPRS